MAIKTAELVIQLRDQVSGPARGIVAALRGIGSSAKTLNNMNVGGSIARGLRGADVTMPIAGSLKTVAGGLGVIAAGRSVTRGFTDMAAFDRRLIRIANTANEATSELARMRNTVRSLAQETATPLSGVLDGLENLVAQGRSLREAMAFLPSVVKSAQASGAEIADIAKSADALANHLKISASEMQLAFDILVAGGKAGQFELKDMARYLPSILPAVRAIGIEGTAGLTLVVSLLQIMRKGAGTSEEAATNLENVLQKMQSNETLKKFKAQGVDLEAVLAKARKEGKNLLDVFEETTWKALGGDISKINKLFEDMQVQKGIRAWLMGRKELREMMREISSTAPGSAMRDLARVTADSQAAVDRLSTSWSGFWQSAGRLIDTVGVSAKLTSFSRMIDTLSDGLNAASTPGGPRESARQFEAWGAETRIKQLDEMIRRREASLSKVPDKSTLAGRFQSWAFDKATRDAASAPETDRYLRSWRIEREELKLKLRQLDAGEAPQIGPEEVEVIKKGEEQRRRERQLRDHEENRALLPRLMKGLDHSSEARTLGGKIASEFGDALSRGLDKVQDEVRRKVGSIVGSMDFSVSPTVTLKIAPAPMPGSGSSSSAGGRQARLDGYYDWYPSAT